MNKIKYIVLCFAILMSCSEDYDDVVRSLETYTQGRVLEIGAVIACAASDKDTGEILTFYYPALGASNIRLYHTNNTLVNENDFANYINNPLNAQPFFNGYLGVFKQDSSIEKWIIITFELDGEIKISNPIRSKQTSQPTVWNDQVIVNQSQSGRPIFMWEDNPVGNNAIYFQVVSDDKDNLLSGTYTYENQFQYYNTNNVVLNITTKTPSDLALNKYYNFTLMDVSADNWVNWVIQKPFIAE